MTQAAPTDTAAAPARRSGYDLLRLLCIAGVVGIHTFGPMVADPVARANWIWYPAAVMSSGFIWVVPVFVMISGALTLRPSAHLDGPGAFLRRRAGRIVPALIVWTFLYLVVIRMLLLGEHIGLRSALTILNDGTAYPQLYFLYLIAGLSFIAPVLAAFLHAGDHRRALALAVVVTAFTLLVFAVPGVLALGGIERPVGLTTLTFWLGYVGYYLLGYALSTARIPRGVFVIAAIAGVLMWATILIQTRNPDISRVQSAVLRPDYLGLGVAIMAVAAFVVGVRLFDRVRLGPRAGRMLQVLADASFGVFLLHLIILLIPYELLPGFRTHTSLGETVLAYASILIISFALVVGARRVPGLRLLF